MEEWLHLLGGATVLVSVFAAIVWLLTPQPGRMVGARDPQIEHEARERLVDACVAATDEEARRAAQESLRTWSERVARIRYRRYPSIAARQAVSTLVVAACGVLTWSIASNVPSEMPVARLVWVFVCAIFFGSALALGVAVAFKVDVFAVQGSLERRHYAEESKLRIPAPCYLDLSAAYDAAERLGGYRLIDTRPQHRAISYPLEGAIAYFTSDERESHFESGIHMDQADLSRCLPDRDICVFVVSDYGRESHELTCQLRDMGYRYAYDLGGIAGCYGRAARISYVLNAVLGVKKASCAHGCAHPCRA